MGETLLPEALLEAISLEPDLPVRDQARPTVRGTFVSKVSLMIKAGLALVGIILLLGCPPSPPVDGSTANPDQSQTTNSPVRDCVEGALVWPETRRPIPVCFESFLDSESMGREIVRQAIQQTWEKASAVQFKGWGECTSSSDGIRIKVADEHPHSAIGTHLDGLPNGMVLNFTFASAEMKKDFAACSSMLGACIRNIAIHEFGHALGFQHEQVKPGPVWCGREQRNVTCESVGDRWDASSVMNYCNEIWNNDGDLSAIDIEAARRWYGPPIDSCTTPTSLCDGRCVNLATDVSHCGMCGHACALDEVCTASSCTCPKGTKRTSAGNCVLDCATGKTACAGKCIDPDTNFLHCGGCNHRCKPHQVCEDGKCEGTRGCEFPLRKCPKQEGCFRTCSVISPTFD